MGSRGMKHSRKGGSRQHLPKVGTHETAREEQHLERAAIADVMGIGGIPAWLRWAGLALGAAILAFAVITLIALD
jgi:hypothetical protein